MFLSRRFGDLLTSKASACVIGGVMLLVVMVFNRIERLLSLSKPGEPGFMG